MNAGAGRNDVRVAVRLLPCDLACWSPAVDCGVSPRVGVLLLRTAMALNDLKPNEAAEG